MTSSRALPARPSLASLRKQAKKLLRELRSGSADAVARVHAQLAGAHLASTHLSLSLRYAQLVIAREYGYAGWEELTAEALERSGKGLEWAARRARRCIHDNDAPGLKPLLAEYPALLTWRGEHGGLLALASNAYSDSFEPARERTYTRRECAELLIEAGAEVDPAIFDGLLVSRARGMLQLYRDKGLLPGALKFFVALGDQERVRASLGEQNVAAVNEAFIVACRFEHEAIATLVLERCFALDPQLGARIDAGPGKAALVRYLIEERPLDFIRVVPAGPWHAFVMHQVVRAIHDDDLVTFERVLRQEPWMLDESSVSFQVGLIERGTLRDRGPFIAKLLELDPALARVRPPPPSQAIEFALTYVKPHLMPLLTRVWTLPQDLPHAAGTGNLHLVQRRLEQSPRQSLDTALAYAVLNHHFEIADCLLQHGADINTRWSSHEPASLLHELVFRDDHEAMQFLIDRGIDMTITDYRWGATAEGWARFGANNEKMAEWLAEAARRRSGAPHRTGSAHRSDQEGG